MHWEAKFTLCSFQHIWTPDVIIHDLVKFNKPEILNQVWNGNFYTICQLPGWCPGNFQWQASLLQSEVVSNYFFQSWNINHQKSFRSDITVVCKAMEFGLYPLDNHKCYLILTSCKCGQLLKYCQMIQYFQTSNNICFIYNIIYIVWSTLQMFLSCDHITMFFHFRIRSTHPHLIHFTYFSLCSQTRFAISWQIKRPPISEYCPYSITISTFDQSSSSFYLFFQLDMTRSIWSLRANGCIGWKWHSMNFWL